MWIIDSCRWARWILLVVMAFSGPVPGALGQTPPKKDPIEIEPTVVTVSAHAQPLSTVTAPVVVVTREEIEASRAANVVDLLRHTPFLHVSQVGARGGLTTVTLRGGDPNFTLVMIDGIPVNDPTNLLGGSFDLSTLTLDNIEQIEIVRGPLSALYGSEAIGGVINILSRKGEGQPEVSVQAMGGSFSNWQVGAATQGAFKRLRYSVTGSYQDIGEQVENDSYSLGTFAFNSDLALSQTGSLQFLVRLHESDASGFPENGGGPEFALLRDAKTIAAREKVFGLKYIDQIRANWSYRAFFDSYLRDEDSFTPAILDSFPPSFSSRPSFDSKTGLDRFRFGLGSTLHMGSRFDVDVGFGVRREDGSSDSVIAGAFPSGFELRRNTASLNGELHYHSSALNANLGLRWDNSDDADAEFSPHAGASYTFAPQGIRLKANWGQGFKLPSFFSLGEPTIGNPELRPERSWGFDVGIEKEVAGPRVLLALSYYRNEFENLIDFSPEQFRLVNRSEVKTQGMEIELITNIRQGLRLGGSLTYLDAEIVGTTEPLRDRPAWRGGVRFDWQINDRSDFHLDTLWVGPRFDFQIPVPDRNQVGGYSSSSLTWSYQLGRDFTLFTRIDNLFNRKFHEFIGFPNPGLYGRVGLIYRFKS